MLMKLSLLITLLCPSLAVCGNLPQFMVNPAKINGRTPAQTELMKRTLITFEKVMNDGTFQADLLNLSFHSDRTDDPNRDLDTAQIVAKLYSGKEHYETEEDSTADIYWAIKKKGFFQSLFTGCSVLGFGNESDKEINTYSCFLNQADLNELVGHLAHEWTHKVGFVHRSDRHPRRDETLPYAFGYLVREHAKRHVTSP